MRPVIAVGIVISAILILGACGVRERADRRLVERARLVMGSELRLTALTASEPAVVVAFDAVFAEFEWLESLMSVWRPGSDVVRLNAAAGDHLVVVSSEVVEVLGVVRQVSEWTDGIFDVIFGALSDLWKFDHDQNNTIPDLAMVCQRLPFVDYRLLDVDPRAGIAFLKQRGMRVHLGGIGKGYAVDRAALILRSRGMCDFMIQVGGDLYVAGLKEGWLWRLGIRDLRGAAIQSFALLDLSDGMFSTLGDYERFFIKDGRRYHHILDLRKGEPARGCRSVMLVTDRVVLVDVLVKGVFILGSDAGMAFIEKLFGVEGVIVSDMNQVLVLFGLKDKLTIVALLIDALQEAMERTGAEKYVANGLNRRNEGTESYAAVRRASRSDACDRSWAGICIFSVALFLL